MLKKGIILLLMAVMLAFTGCSSSVEQGIQLLEEEKFAEAQEMFQESIDNGEELAESFRGLGVCCWEMEEYALALEAFEQALNEGTEPTAVLYNLMGVSAFQTEEIEKALYYFEEGQNLEGAEEEVLKEMAFNVIVCYEELGEYELAKEAVDEYLSKYPDDEKVRKEQDFLSTQS